jgi:hypothetical protein
LITTYLDSPAAASASAFVSRSSPEEHDHPIERLDQHMAATIPEMDPYETMLPDGSFMVSHLVAERHVSKRQFKGDASTTTKRQFRVRWVGYRSADDTWEDESSILTPVLITNFERLRDEAGGDLRAAARMQLDSMGIEMDSPRVEKELGAGCATWLRHSSGVMAAASVAAAEQKAWQWIDACWNQRGRKAAPGRAREEAQAQQQQPPSKRPKPEHQGSVLSMPTWEEQEALDKLASKLEQVGGSAELLDGWSADCRTSGPGRKYTVYCNPDGKSFWSLVGVLRHFGYQDDVWGGASQPSRPSTSHSIRKPHAPGLKDIWVSCDRCKKWRRLHVRGGRKAVPAVWYCELNPDPLYDDCGHEQEEYETEEEDVEEEEAEVEAPLVEEEMAKEEVVVVEEEGAQEAGEEAEEVAALVEKEMATEEKEVEEEGAQEAGEEAEEVAALVGPAPTRPSLCARSDEAGRGDRKRPSTKEAAPVEEGEEEGAQDTAARKRPRRTSLTTPPVGCRPPEVPASQYADGHRIKSADGSTWEVQGSTCGRSSIWEYVDLSEVSSSRTRLAPADDPPAPLPPQPRAASASNCTTSSDEGKATAAAALVDPGHRRQLGLSATVARPGNEVTCEGCGRVFTSKHGLMVHLRFCKGGGGGSSMEDDFDDDDEYEGIDWKEYTPEIPAIATGWPTARRPPAPPPRCVCHAECVWLRGRWFCAKEECEGGCGFESDPLPEPTPLTPLCRCTPPLPCKWLLGRWWCAHHPNATRSCGFEDLPTPPHPPPTRMHDSEVSLGMSRDIACMLTASAYALDDWCFVAPSDCGLGLFARCELLKGQQICEYDGPRLPLELLKNGAHRGEYALEVPRSGLFIDGAHANCPPIVTSGERRLAFSGPVAAAIYANHSSQPNAKLLHVPATSDTLDRILLVARETIRAGSEVRLDYEDGGRRGTYWGTRGQPGETSWRENVYLATPPPSGREPIFHRHKSAARASMPSAPRGQQQSGSPSTLAVDVRMRNVDLSDDDSSPSRQGRAEEIASGGWHSATSTSADATVPWGGPAGGDAILTAVLSVLKKTRWSQQCAQRADGKARMWQLVASHHPGRTATECQERWKTLSRVRTHTVNATATKPTSAPRPATSAPPLGSPRGEEVEADAAPMPISDPVLPTATEEDVAKKV